MSKVKILPSEYIGSTELNRFQEFLTNSSSAKILKMLIKSYGHIPSIVWGTIGSLYVGYAGPGRMRLFAGLAVDSDLNIITVEEDTVFSVPPTATPNTSKWVLVSYATTNKERGRVSVSADGSMSGSGTEFLKTLRGTPGEPVSVRFPNAQNNLGEYPVSEVNGDTSAILNAIGLYDELDLEYEVLGAFPSDSFVSTADRKIYEHDYFEIEISEFLPLDTDKRIPCARLNYGPNGELLGFTDIRPQYKLSL